MVNATEQEERAYLEEIKERLAVAIRRVDDAVRQYSTELRQKKQYLYEHQSGLDEADMVAAGQSIDRMAFTGEASVARKRRLFKLSQSPYFGRVDFTPKGGKPVPVYIGVYAFADERQNVIFDWRAPISSLFYDFELGPATYLTPAGGTVAGHIDLKRQFRIRDGRLEYLLDSSVNIHDDVLQQELAKSSDDKMKNIVATIQRDQNAVIRNDEASVMVIQGVAGSGKTSIALHRVAFLLYRHRDTIAAHNVLIISPNKVFADYISNVLPELGEEHIPEMGMEELATELLGPNHTFQTFFEQVARLLDGPDPGFVERLRYKSSVEFLGQLNQYLLHIENHYLTFQDIRVGRTVVPAAVLRQKFGTYHRVPLLKRFGLVAVDVRAYVRDAVGRKLTNGEKNSIEESLLRLFRFRHVAELYRDFYQWLGRPELLKLDPHRAHLEYADVFALLYLRIRLEGLGGYEQVKHLLIDEMQDYTPVQYAVLARLFSCRKTILGDISQSVNPYSASSADTIERVFPQAEVVRLLRSYRSTVEITALAQRILPTPGIEPLERHGPEPALLACPNAEAERATIRQALVNFQASGRQSMGVICKTSRQARQLHQAVEDLGAHLLTADSSLFKEGIIITTAHLSKGLEFDEVLVPFASARTYHTEVDQRMLYVACTRAMHRLTLTHTGELTTFLR